MTRNRLMAGICVAALGLAAGSVAMADDLDEVIVTGTRSTGRTSLTSANPIDVVGADALAATGYTDLARALEFADPAINFPRAATTPTSANTRPVTLSGFSPDEVLVLVDGKRWHTSAVLDTNFSVGRGSAPFDLSAIPAAAIDHVEVLRDGAAAQYGSDAIAGVVNIILKDNSAGGIASLQGGVTERGDGANGDLSVSQGFDLGRGGFLTLTADGNAQEFTNRAAIDHRYGRVTYRIGDPADSGFELAAKGGYTLGDLGRLYVDFLVSRKDSTDYPTFGTPGASPLYPQGFLPNGNPVVWDIGGTVGLRGDLPCGVTFDLSDTLGYTSADFTVDHSANAALGAASPTRFYAGTPSYLENTADLTLSRPLPEILAGGNIAAGAQFRYQYYRIESGDAASTAGAGAVAFPGYNPRIAVDNGRTAGAGFIDAELKPASVLTLGAAGRYDGYSDFGAAATWKASARLEATSWLAFRASAGTGFRAPSLQQDYYNSVTSVANGANKALVNVGTFQVDDPVAKALGATPLKAERSRNTSAGLVATPLPRLAITADLFRVDVENRIALSDALSGAAVTRILTGAGITNVQQAAFFTNGLGTRTQGGSVTLSYKGDLDRDTQYALTAAYDRTLTAMRSLVPDAALPGVSLIGLHSRLLLTEAQPRDKLTSSVNLIHGPVSGTIAVTRYGEYTDAPILAAQTFSAKTLVDLSLSADLPMGAAVTAGVLNIGDVMPDALTYAGLSTAPFGGSFVYGEESPFGVGGRSYYVRLAVRF